MKNLICVECGEEMNDMATNYGTPEYPCCNLCYSYSSLKGADCYGEKQQQKKEVHPLFQTLLKPATPDWWNDLYTDVTGQCFSDADPGL